MRNALDHVAEQTAPHNTSVGRKGSSTMAPNNRWDPYIPSRIDVPAVLPMIGIRNRVLFPGGALRLTVGRQKSVRLIQHIWRVRGPTAGGTGAGAGKVPSRRFALSDKPVLILVVAMRPPATDEQRTGTGSNDAAQAPIPPGGDPNLDTFDVGTAARIVHIARTSLSPLRFSVLVQGLARLRVGNCVAFAAWCP